MIKIVCNFSCNKGTLHLATIHRKQISLTRLRNFAQARAHHLQSLDILINPTSQSTKTLHRQSTLAASKHLNGRVPGHFLCFKGLIPLQDLLLEVLHQAKKPTEASTPQTLTILLLKICGQTEKLKVTQILISQTNITLRTFLVVRNL